MTQWWRAAGAQLKRAAEISRGYHTIQAVPREVTGRKVASKERAQGRIPAVVFGEQGEDGVVSRKRLLSTEKKQIQSILKFVHPDYFCSTTFKLQVRAGSGSSEMLESGTVLPIKLHRNEETGEILNMVLVWAEEGSKLTVNVPVVIKGEETCPGLKKGGQLNKIRSTLKLLCPVDEIPQKIEVDISNLDVGDKVLLNDVEVHPSVKLLSKNETKPVCKIAATSAES
ncbi:hypothetical protein V2J09_021769 [Rumex salicifolius]